MRSLGNTLLLMFFSVAIVQAHSVQLSAEVLTVPSTNVGSYDINNASSSPHYSANEFLVANTPHTYQFWQEDRNFAIFDLSGVTGHIVSAALRTNSGDYVLRSHEVTIEFHSYGGSIPALTDGTADFADLANGTLYGSMTFPAAFPDDTPVDIDLNSSALADLNAASGLFAIAGNQPIATTTSGIFAGVNSTQVFLVLDVQPIPEPASLALWSVCGMIVWGYYWQKRRR